MNITIEYNKYTDHNNYCDQPFIKSTTMDYEDFENYMKTRGSINYTPSNPKQIHYVIYIRDSISRYSFYPVMLEKMAYNKAKEEHLKYICYKYFYDGRVHKIDGYDTDRFNDSLIPNEFGLSYRISESDNNPNISPYKLGDIVWYWDEYDKHRGIIVYRNMDDDSCYMGKGINRVYEVIPMGYNEPCTYIHHDDILYKTYNDLHLLKYKVYNSREPFSSEYKTFIDDYIKEMEGKNHV